jgi:hypothetical protein
MCVHVCTYLNFFRVRGQKRPSLPTDSQKIRIQFTAQVTDHSKLTPTGGAKTLVPNETTEEKENWDITDAETTARNHPASARQELPPSKLCKEARNRACRLLISKAKGTSKHYRRMKLCRVLNDLPSVFFRALGKEALCRVPNKIHSAKQNTRQRAFFAECFFLTLGKEGLCRVFFLCTRQRQISN